MTEALLKVFLADSLCKPSDIIKSTDIGVFVAALSSTEIKAIHKAGYSVAQLSDNVQFIGY